MPHALVIGGTGMLKGAVLELTLRGWKASVVARSRARLDQLTNRAPAGTIHPIARDWLDPARFATCLTDAIAHGGTPDLVLLWIHTAAAESRRLLIDRLDSIRCPRVVEVLSSRSMDQPQDPKAHRGVVWQTVVLGCIPSGNTHRWLTHSEIVAGVIDAIDHPGRPTTRVGQRPPGIGPDRPSA